MMKTTQAQVVRHESLLRARLEQKQALLEHQRHGYMRSVVAITDEEWIELSDEQDIVDFVRAVYRALGGKWAKSMEFVAQEFSESVVNEADAWMQSWIREVS
jgi:hypothetical protein